MERFQGFKFHEKSEKNTFAFSNSHRWVWHYNPMVPQGIIQHKNSATAHAASAEQKIKSGDPNGLAQRPTISSNSNNAQMIEKK